MSSIDYERLLYALKNVLLDEQWANYDLHTIVRNAQICWDGTGVLVKSSDFEFVFDIVSYDVINVNTNDLREV